MRVVMVDPGAFTPFHDDALCRALAADTSECCEVELVTAPFTYHPWPAAQGYARHERFAPGGGQAGVLARTLRRLRRVCSYPLAWRRLVRELAQRPPAIVHLQWSLLPAVERPALGRLRAAGVVVVQTVHNPRPHPGEGLQWAPGGPLRDAVDAWVVHSEAMAKTLLEDHPALAGRVRVVRPGIEGRGAGGESDRTRARERLRLDPTAPLALFLGLIRPYKGLELLLEAFPAVLRELPAARLVVAGLPRPSFRELAREIERLRLGEHVTTDLRYLPQSVMDDYLMAADLVVLPYREASQSAVLGAALGCDRAVVASAVGGLAEMLSGDGEEMLVPPGDSAALAERISRLLGDRPAAAELGRRAGESARRRFSWPAAAAETAALYRELTRDSPIRSGVASASRAAGAAGIAVRPS